MRRPRILLADDHPLTSEGIRIILEVHYEIVAIVTDGRALVETALRLAPDLIIVDITMPLLNGIDAALQIKKIPEGRTAREIAGVLCISRKTVDFHRDNIKRKLGLRTTAELTRHALEQGLI